jgi:glycosyltransferase involved in cell wall biosynthesis
LHWFLDDVLPLLRIDGLRVEIAGFCALPSLLAKASDRVRFLGLAPDLDPVYDRARVFVAPTRFAAGLPMKIHEAASKGVPVVATPLLAHQLGWEDGRDLVVGDNAENFARAIETLWSDPGKWSAVRSSALDRIREQCGRTTFLTGLADMLRAHCHSGREAHLEL